MSDEGKRLGVLVVDDSEEFLEVACSWIDAQPGLTVAGTARNGVQAIAALETVDAGLVLMDAFMPLMDGFAATRRIKTAASAPWVVIVSVHEGSAMEHEAWAAGADGFVPKSDLAARMPAMIGSLRAGQAAPTGRSAQRRRPAPSEDLPAERRAEAPGWSAIARRAWRAAFGSVDGKRVPTKAPRRLVFPGRASAKG